jgi:hypothetical protein
MAQQLVLPGLWQQGHCLRHVVLLQQCHWHVARQLSLSCRHLLQQLVTSSAIASDLQNCWDYPTLTACTL